MSKKISTLSNLSQRVIVGVLGAAVFIGSICLSEWTYFLLFLGLTLLGIAEFYKMVRVQGIRANASRCSHAELDAMTEVDSGDPAALAIQYHELRARHPHLTVLGGCCGTDQRHIEAIARKCLSPSSMVA